MGGLGRDSTGSEYGQVTCFCKRVMNIPVTSNAGKFLE